MSAATQTPTISEAAHLAWAAQAELNLARSLTSFRTKLFTTVKIPRDSYAVDPDFFPGEYEPSLRLGVRIDGLEFCLDDHGALAVIAWRCEDKKCENTIRTPFRDLQTLGAALAHGQQVQERTPKCRHHA